MSKDNTESTDEFGKLFPLSNDLPPLPDTSANMDALTAIMAEQNELFKLLPSEAQNADNLTQMLNADAANLKIEGNATRLQQAYPLLSRRDAVQIARLDAGVLPHQMSYLMGCAVARTVVNEPQEREKGVQWFQVRDRAQRKAESVARAGQFLSTTLLQCHTASFDAEYPNLTEAHWNQIAFCLEQSELALMYAVAVLEG